ncbi:MULTISPECIES: DUF555 domain-containing protein [Methanococcus]|jgi:hypothetical protein|uniref:UPF0212 protein MMP1509 n=10 Tax=Methanococcus TaxID=2184 RepID=Y1509_METMP|nr:MULTISPECIES: DUF555 domain-containing protein [Methanococcus]A4FW14.1 RecName: Full=UPF0212 protein MmarC5_0068 [Methanococcus maripaludis C5]A6UQF3.1 RecName: Full=UPF0212 protein Mevan_0819 [Methanococcus vannielii SB]A6VH94.1 RecName: Full=UPF0212 protein MmarC7_0753 [Methanococcus maripaludis C7]A9A9F5.1 RecName: Full=UPF0212 protein MmarC6_1165 [Methanococcus maripaludis C6]P0CW68.1 RecName: Full=UPF0212 protein in gatA 3'region [Methanococcus maripaludis]P0CW69.1 RecName: Full=UPF02
MGNYHVTLQASYIAKNVEDVEDAIGVAISQIGKLLNKGSLDYVDIDVGLTICPKCGEPIDCVLVVAKTAIVGILLSMKVFNAESPEHAVRIAKSSIGRALKDIPLEDVDVVEI